MKQVLTPILTSLPTESQWKTRQESIRLLGTMAYCNPKQLASCLSQIIPILVEASNDIHPKVRETSKLALHDISSIIKNPEILHLSPILLSSLADPSNKTKEALEALLECEFMHSIDSASLALLHPILCRALRDRATEMKRKSCAITGNIIHMVDEKRIILSYLPQLVIGLQDCLIDPIPDVRASSAKAIGSIIGEFRDELDNSEYQVVKDLQTWLLQTLGNETSSVERSGAAQGLSEVCYCIHDNQMKDLIQQVLVLGNNEKYTQREGVQWLLSFLPLSLQHRFSKYISLCLPNILQGLNDDIESVRDVALRAGQVLVSTLGLEYASLILPSLIVGMFHDDWRIRQSSVILTGDLINKMSENDIEDDYEEGESGSSSGSKTLSILKHSVGNDLTKVILASLFIIRFDSSNAVRQISLAVSVSYSLFNIIHLISFVYSNRFGNS